MTGYVIAAQHYILKTTNSGDNWSIIYNDTSTTNGFSRIEFIDQTTGYVGGFISENFNYHILKTTNAGISWFYINGPYQQAADDMFVLNEDTVWIVNSGALWRSFRTTNGGWSGQNKFNCFRGPG